jgi:hypothetical protein
MILITCVYAPYTLAFMDDVPLGITILDSLINLLFLVDILMNFVSAYEDKQMNMVTSHKVSIITLKIYRKSVLDT